MNIEIFRVITQKNREKDLYSHAREKSIISSVMSTEKAGREAKIGANHKHNKEKPTTNWVDTNPDKSKITSWITILYKYHLKEIFRADQKINPNYVFCKKPTMNMKTHTD